MSNGVDDSGKQSYRDLLIAGLENLHGDIKDLRRDLAEEKKDRAEAERLNEARITRLETKIALYSGIGALLGGALVEVITRQLHL